MGDIADYHLECLFDDCEFCGRLLLDCDCQDTCETCGEIMFSCECPV